MATCEYCDTEFDPEDDNGCPPCYREIKRQQEYHRAMFRNQPSYTREEIDDCYSEPCEYQKRIGALRSMDYV